MKFREAHLKGCWKGYQSVVQHLQFHLVNPAENLAGLFKRCVCVCREEGVPPTALCFSSYSRTSV